MRVFFTGGAGKAGRHAIPHLVGQGHRVTNIDLARLNHPGVPDLRVDLTDGHQVFNAMASPASGADLDEAPAPYDAVVHFAAIPSMFLTADSETYRVNVLSTFNVLDAATKLGIRKIVIASSETTYGVCFAQGEVRPLYIPVDEEHPTVPQDAYAMSKVCNEATARSFQARTGSDIYALRINNVIEPHEYSAHATTWREHPEVRRRNIFAYIDARDLGHMVDRCLATDGLGYQVFNVANDDSSVGLPSAEVIRRFYEGLPLHRPLGEHETFYSNAKARRLLGFAPAHGWRDLP
ncbi:NAD-dependent epimerase/dehydratase family protein [Rubellimicrobium aerolatum]|uniref:NAD-dependent epimerase/dehydratase family protein n=1 Tax=Rubellimicrobium aerolatum TaxID=490979 RepID=A0ABW0S8Z1_9RHOB|nr:NAD(P)-dependent oxidoreductase [Rubellimicrobium aerolatum]MBP1804764.1 nucleoside-diphosphate-sugar epimerase [Rubellimicrobium aerolatum]